MSIIKAFKFKLALIEAIIPALGWVVYYIYVQHGANSTLYYVYAALAYGSSLVWIEHTYKRLRIANLRAKGCHLSRDHPEYKNFSDRVTNVNKDISSACQLASYFCAFPMILSWDSLPEKTYFIPLLIFMMLCCFLIDQKSTENYRD
ncbi:TPA: hypothetical protein ACPVZG_000075 [Vibrio parahaemolyticus]|uniref:Uncharacterized protein n=1 Tax=Vibrio parahaemolyticus TaxID=670 RepID=A0AAW8Q6P5_VIBPH|nr:hypothetical protein [Vibrio parahaemolyticus]MDS1823852.1 hypothetical protein [Vibrio parahaemolyticus]